MARGSSKSDGFAKVGSPADLRNRALEAQASQSAASLREASKVAVQGILSSLSGLAPKLSKDELDDLASWAAAASEQTSEHLASHTESVKAGKEVLANNKKGTYPFDDFDELTRGLGVNLLTPEEMKEADEEEGGDYAEKMSQVLDYEYSEDVMSDTRGNYRRTNYDNDDRNEANENWNKMQFAKGFIKSRLADAERTTKALYAELDRTREDAVRRWLPKRGIG